MGGDVKRLGAEVDTLSKALVKDTATWTHKNAAVKSEVKAADNLRKQAKQHDAEVAKEAERLSALEETHAASVAALKASEEAAEAAEITLTGVQSGTGAGGDGNKSLQTQLGDATAAAAQADADAKAAALKVKHADKELTAQNKVRPNAGLSPAAASSTAFALYYTPVT